MSDGRLQTTRNGAHPVPANAFFRFAADIVLAHADALKHPGEEPWADQTEALDTSTAPTPHRALPASSPPATNVIHLDTRRPA